MTDTHEMGALHERGFLPDLKDGVSTASPSMNTRMYIDVDGTVSPIGDQAPTGSGWDTWASGRAFGFTVFWAVQLIAELNEITARRGVQPVWLTSWGGASATDLAPATGLHGEEWPTLSVTHGRGSWKLNALRKDLAGQAELGNKVDRIVWLDDDLGKNRAARVWAKTSPIPILRVIPRTKVGLTAEHLCKVREFLR